ncbi:MAG: ATP-binding protein [Ignavibacteria bacterium]|nr:ATP-binding protein [Ignavibacteria bacterium]
MSCSWCNPPPRESGSRCSWRGAEERRPLDVDAGKIAQVLVNLLNNAIEHSTAGARVWLASRWEGADALFSVRDEGAGIAPEDQARIFSAFSRVGSRKTAGERSTGLGLSIARQVVDAHGGRIWVESVPGAGATFFVFLPADAAASAPPVHVDRIRHEPI